MIRCVICSKDVLESNAIRDYMCCYECAAKFNRTREARLAIMNKDLRRVVQDIRYIKSYFIGDRHESH